MRVGVLADSGGDGLLWWRAARRLLEHHGCERLFFLGGCWDDVEAAQAVASLGGLAWPQVPLVRVSERANPASGEFLRVPEIINGQLCLLVHNKADLSRDDIASAVIIFHGHSAGPGVARFGPRTFVTPGRLAPGPAGEPGTVAVVSAGTSQVDLEFYDLTGHLILAENVVVAGGTRFKAT